MALLTSASDAGSQDVLCSAGQRISPLGGMVFMYMLMSAFHLTPWFKLASSRLDGARPV
jgi:hypothetical protein